EVVERVGRLITGLGAAHRGRTSRSAPGLSSAPRHRLLSSGALERYKAPTVFGPPRLPATSAGSGPQDRNRESAMAYRVEINGEARELDVPADMPLLWALRNELGMVGTKFGCGVGLCGACTVHVDGVAQRSCSLPVGSIGEAKVTTTEALGQTPVGQALQQAWLDQDVMQCGYCQAGQLMNASALLTRNPKPDDRQIEAAMSGNICRCACYTRIHDAIAMVAEKGTANACVDDALAPGPTQGRCARGRRADAHRFAAHGCASRHRRRFRRTCEVYVRLRDRW